MATTVPFQSRRAFPLRLTAPARPAEEPLYRRLSSGGGGATPRRASPLLARPLAELGDRALIGPALIGTFTCDSSALLAAQGLPRRLPRALLGRPTGGRGERPTRQGGSFEASPRPVRRPSAGQIITRGSFQQPAKEEEGVGGLVSGERILPPSFLFGVRGLVAPPPSRGRNPSPPGQGRGDAARLTQASWGLLGPRTGGSSRSLSIRKASGRWRRGSRSTAPCKAVSHQAASGLCCSRPGSLPPPFRRRLVFLLSSHPSYATAATSGSVCARPASTSHLGGDFLATRRGGGAGSGERRFALPASSPCLPFRSSERGEGRKRRVLREGGGRGRESLSTMFSCCQPN